MELTETAIRACMVCVFGIKEVGSWKKPWEIVLPVFLVSSSIKYTWIIPATVV